MKHWTVDSSLSGDMFDTKPGQSGTLDSHQWKDVLWLDSPRAMAPRPLT